MAIDASTVSEIIAAVAGVVAAGGLGGAVHTKKKSSKLGERVAKLEAYHESTKQNIKAIQKDVREIKDLLMKGK